MNTKREGDVVKKALSGFTPGPWKHDRCMIEQGNKVIGEVYKAGDYEPGSKTMIIPSKKEGEANAALIASAPKLLEACKHAISHTNDVNWQMIVNAIAKAEAR